MVSAAGGGLFWILSGVVVLPITLGVISWIVIKLYRGE
jgi:hypothetical protein